jgi:hypothetical protein
MRRLVLIVLASVMFVSAPALQAFDAAQKQEALAAKALALPALAPQYDQARVDLYLSDPVWTSWNQAHGGNWVAQYDTLTGHPRRVLGGAIPWATPTSTAADVERVAREFIAANAAVLGVSNDRLRFVPAIATPTADGKMRYAAFDYAINNVPVENARLVFAINSGNMIYWHSSNIADVPVTTNPAITVAQALANVLAYAGVAASDVSVVQQPTLKLLPRNTTAGGLLSYQLAYETLFRLKAGTSTWAAYTDATSGAVIGFGDTNRYADACPATRTTSTGRVTGGIRPAQATDAEVVRSFPLATIDTPAGPAVTNANGLFTFTGGRVSTGMNGRFFDSECVSCVKSQSDPVDGWQAFVASNNGHLNLGTGGFDQVNAPGAGNTISYGNGISTPAERTAFFHTNVARLIALKWLDLPWLKNTTIPVKVNINDVCNAFWDGGSLNFFKKGDAVNSSGAVVLSCRNTGEIRDVMQHEWGHGLDANDGHPPGYTLATGLGDMATGEAAGDHIALFVDHDACIGQSFASGRNTGKFVTDPDTMAIATCDGVRDMDELRSNRGTLSVTNVTQKCPTVSTGSPLYFGPLMREGHCEGEIWGQAGWHLVQDLMTGRQYGTVVLDANKQFVTNAGSPLPAGKDGSPNPGFDRDLAWTIHERLHFDSRPLVGSYAPSRHQAIGPSVYDGYLVVDDEGDGLMNGTPHAAYINDAFVHHGMEEWGLPGGVPSGVDVADCATLPSPNVTLTQGIDAASGEPSVTVSWAAVAGASSYTVLRNERRDDVFLEVGKTTGTSLTDVGPDNGVTYNYRVQANGSGGCYSISGGGVKSIRVAQPRPSFDRVTINDSNGGNGDGGLDPGERAQLFVILRNSGYGNLTNVSATITSTTPGVTVTKAGPRTYGSLAEGSSAGPNMSFVVSLDSTAALCGSEANFVIAITSDQGCFVDAFAIPIGSDGTSCVVFKDTNAQPVSVAITSDRLSATCGDGDLVPDPGETVQVTVKVNNNGTKAASNVTVALATDKPYLHVVSASPVNIGSLAGSAAETKTATFNVSVDRTAPFNDLATLTASVTAGAQSVPNTLGLTTRVNRDKVLSTVTNDFNTGAQGWTPAGDANGWTLGLKLQSGDATQLFRIANYTSNTCELLYSPTLEFSATSAVSFDIGYVSENSSPADAAYDGANLQISVDGGKTWSVVELTEGYPALAYGDGCMTKSEPFFSGVGPLMKRYNADLSAFAGQTGLLRFHFSSDPLVEVPDGGAWVDNVTASNIVVAAPSAICP